MQWAFQWTTSRRISESDAVMKVVADFLPATLKPELATLVSKPPKGSGEWLYEIKFDGYRLLTRIEGESIQLFTRNANDWSHRLKPLERSIRALKLPDGWYDGEIVVLNDQGIRGSIRCSWLLTIAKHETSSITSSTCHTAPARTYAPFRLSIGARNWAPALKMLILRQTAAEATVPHKRSQSRIILAQGLREIPTSCGQLALPFNSAVAFVVVAWPIQSDQEPFGQTFVQFC